MVTIPYGNEDDLQAATATAGPIAVSVDASSNAFRVSYRCTEQRNHAQMKMILFQFYEGGVFDEPNCYNQPSRLTHSMLIIGYGTYKGKDYWLVKNRYAPSLSHNL